MQRHHILPFQLIASQCFSRMFTRLGLLTIGFDDFRRNGLLLPASDDRATLLGLPLHRGPHATYNAMVMERVGQIEARWAREQLRRADAALTEAQFRLDLLQRALRRRLLSTKVRPFALNRRDPALAPAAFADLDAMADLLWADSAAVEAGDMAGAAPVRALAFA